MTRQKMSESVSRGFRKHGYAGIGVDALAKGAGVTSGAFYAHFGSKNKAFELALTMGLDEVITNLPVFFEQGDKWLENFVDYYLSSAHLQDLECGCAMASLTAEVVRSPQEAQTIYQEKMQQIAELMAQGLAGEQSKQRAWAVLAMLTGGVNLLRALGNAQAVTEIAQGLRNSVLELAGQVSVRQ